MKHLNQIGAKGLNLIKEFEGLRLVAYKCPAGVWTIGYGHTYNVKEGDVITQGQQIAEVGSTGNVTGPHLHFEIRYQDRIVDPEYILGEM